jgi:acylpyruvate hydrolase
MIFKIPELISYISQIMTLNNGDLILTGTPAGVGPVKAGQTLVGRLLSNKQIISTFAFPVIDRK